MPLQPETAQTTPQKGASWGKPASSAKELLLEICISSMSWFGGGKKEEKKEASEFDAFVPPPPAGNPLAPPPEPPRSWKGLSGDLAPPVGEFKGFSPPPIASTDTKKSAAAAEAPAAGGLATSLKPPTSFIPMFGRKSSPTGEDEYAKEDFSRYLSPVVESDGLRDDAILERERRAAMHGGREPWITNPRVLACLESIKMGINMGAMVGGIFGALTGVYASIVQRNILLFPLSVIGGAVSFGFFLGCGMVVRCEDRHQGDDCDGGAGYMRQYVVIRPIPSHTRAFGGRRQHHWAGWRGKGGD
ncbi:unnamed protein product [Vitrella brassicaformis CCMP3155]|uniref:Reactive oxygen species modulator 1 n=1 Tax=Vitrella brassicaformis (strain CCMP3155) TaxID=1169540 RepID=A0A0G4EN18_VITBC|nr:unnamed protein product [Vitrella brassicaformis CCMP3155]|eukprot:CEL98220.1 unnamed protein product [Vitrella brassicaformis CCMP3155]